MKLFLLSVLYIGFIDKKQPSKSRIIIFIEGICKVIYKLLKYDRLGTIYT